MKAMIVSLENEVSKRANIQEQCERYKLDFEFIDAVDGKMLSKEILKMTDADFSESYLTPGEIGCALSHLYIYKKMISESLESVLVLEDDAILSDNCAPKIGLISDKLSKTKPEICLLNDPESIYPLLKKKITSDLNLYKLARGCGGHAYIINKHAARILLNENLPIKFEADRWMCFRDFSNISVWCLRNGIIDTNDHDKVHSSIEFERKALRSKRERHLNNLNKKQKGYQRKRLLHLFLRKLTHEIIKRPNQ